MSRMNPVSHPEFETFAQGKSNELVKKEGSVQVRLISLDLILNEPGFASRRKKDGSLDNEKVLQMMKSVYDKGIISPIGLRAENPKQGASYRVIYGDYRLEAWKRLHAWAQSIVEDDEFITEEEQACIDQWSAIPATVYGHTTPDEVCEWMALAENHDRVELSEQERATSHARIGRLMDAMRKGGLITFTDGKGFETFTVGKGFVGGKRGPKRSWFKLWQVACGIPPNTGHVKWQTFLEDTGKDKDLVPSKANDVEREEFFTWYEHGSAASRKKNIEVIDERVRKTAEAKFNQWNEALEQLITTFDVRVRRDDVSVEVLAEQIPVAVEHLREGIKSLKALLKGAEDDVTKLYKTREEAEEAIAAKETGATATVRKRLQAPSLKG